MNDNMFVLKFYLPPGWRNAPMRTSSVSRFISTSSAFFSISITVIPNSIPHSQSQGKARSDSENTMQQQQQSHQQSEHEHTLRFGGKASQYHAAAISSPEADY